ncbi:MAG: tRNA uracil 4-sulfurtransferase ThiI, partial [Candidatus Hydrothermarchaeaceae archaeon]
SKRTRKGIEAVLIKNIKHVIGQENIRQEFGRIFVESDSRDVAEKIAKVFGVVSTSVATKTSSEMGDILKEGKKLAKKIIKGADTFAVRARRTGEHPYGSQDVEAKLGAEIVRATGAKVNLTKPDKTVYVEVREGEAYIFDTIIKGVGGLPLGSQGRAVALISGGIDSPVAAWMMMKRGVELVCIHMDNSELFGDSSRLRATECIEELSRWNGRIRTYMVPQSEILEEIGKSGKLTCVLCKRAMLRVAEIIAKREGAKAVITGESLGQVASQTLDNLYVIDQAVSMPVFRPLIGTDKMDIVRFAQEIGTYEISIRSAPFCQGLPKYPETRATLKTTIDAESAIDIEGLVTRAVKRAEVIEVG